MAADDPWPRGGVGLHQGEYRDEGALDEVHYLECKLILKPDRLTCVQDFHDYGSIVWQAAHQCEIGFSTKRAAQLKPQTTNKRGEAGEVRFDGNGLVESLQTELQTNHAAQDGTGHYKPGSLHEKCQTREHA